MNNYLRKRNELGFIDENFLHDMFGLPKFNREYNIMKTDVKEEANNYLLEVDMPGYDKENIKINFENGYLTITGEISVSNSNSEKEKLENNYLRKERYYGTVTRSYYFGEDIDEKSIKACFKNGVLSVNVPKKLEQEPEEKRFITIE